VKPYQVQGLLFVGICLVIGLILAIGSSLIRERPRTATANVAQRTDPSQALQPSYPSAQPASRDTIAPSPDHSGGLASEDQLSPVGSYPAQPARSGDANAQERAAQLAYDYFAALSGDPAEALSYVSRTFAPWVQHYGVGRSREQILSAKARYMVRWPQRSYRIQPSSLSVACDDDGSGCTVSGIVDYSCASPERHAVSRGVTSFSLRLSREGDAFAITSESGEVLRRL
jgi:hypothetical protein